MYIYILCICIYIYINKNAQYQHLHTFMVKLTSTTAIPMAPMAFLEHEPWKPSIGIIKKYR